MGLAISAFCPKKQPGQQRDIVVKRDWLITGRAGGRRTYNGFVSRQPINHHVQKTAYAAARREKKYKPIPIRNHNILAPQQRQSLNFFIHSAGNFHLQPEKANKAGSIFGVIFLAHRETREVNIIHTLATLNPGKRAAALEKFQFHRAGNVTLSHIDKGIERLS